METSARERLLMQLTVGPVTQAVESAFHVAKAAFWLNEAKRVQKASSL